MLLFLGAFFAAAKNRAFRLYLLPPAAPKGYRCNPLRGRKPSAFALGVLRSKTPGTFSQSGFGFAEFARSANSWASLGTRAEWRSHSAMLLASAGKMYKSINKKQKDADL
jgi:hypothetical protein